MKMYISIRCITRTRLSIWWFFIFFFNDTSSTGVYDNNWGITHVNINKVKYSWTIDNYSLVGLGISESLESPIYSGDDGSQWKLRLYPKGENEDNKESVSLFVFLNNKVNVTVSYKFYIIDGNGTKTNYHSSTQIFNGSGWGWSKFILQSDLQDKTKNLLPNDSLTIFAETSFKEGITNISGSCRFKKNDYNTESMAMLLENNFLTDVQLRVANQTLKAHRAILATHSTWFLQEFTKNPELDAVYIENTTTAMATQALRFMYTGKTEITGSTAEELLSLSNQLGIPQLKVMCEEFLCKSMKPTNAIHILLLAELHDAKNLGREVSNYIAGHADSVADSPDFVELEKSYPNPFYGILRTMINKRKA